MKPEDLFKTFRADEIDTAEPWYFKSANNIGANVIAFGDNPDKQNYALKFTYKKQSLRRSYMVLN